MKLALAATLVVALTFAGPARAEQLSDGEIVAWGAGFAVPTYFLGVTLHEGAHAVAAWSVGAHIEEIKLWPGFVDGRFYFGYTRWSGALTRDEHVFALLGPTILELGLLGGYALLLDQDALPDDDRAALAVAMIPAIAWVDIVKNLISFNDTNDMMRVHALHGRTREVQRLPIRVLQLAVAVGGGVVLYRGARKIFDEPDGTASARVLPLFTLTF